ncbi:MAG: DUF1189 family protein [bacterium]
MAIRIFFKNFFKWLAFSVDTRIYPSLRALPVKLTLSFMILLIGISAMIIGVKIAVIVREKIIEMGRIYETHFPPAKLVDGMLILENDEPIIYKGTDYQIVMDVTGNEYQREAEFPIALIFLRDRMIIDTESSGTKEYKYSILGQTDMTVTSQTIDSTKGITSIIAFFFWTGLLLINWSVQTALMTLIGSFIVGIVAAFSRILLPRNEQLKIALTAAVPVIILTVIEHLFLIIDNVGLYAGPLPGALLAFNIAVFTAFVVFGTRGYLKPFIPKDNL